MSKKNWHYVVTHPDSTRPMMVGHYDDTPRGGVLMHGDFGTLFTSRHAAQRAIERTEQYELYRKLQWHTGRCEIHRVGTQD